MNRIHTIPALLAAVTVTVLAVPGCNKRSALTGTDDAGDTATASADGTDPTSTSGADASTSGADGDTGMDTASDTGDSDDGEGTGDDCGSFLGCTDVPEVDTPICSPWTQNCADIYGAEGNKCTFVMNEIFPEYDYEVYDWWSCRSSGEDTVGSACQGGLPGSFGTDSCDNTGVCLGAVESGEVSVCTEICVGSPEDSACPQSGDTCVQLNHGILTICVAECSPFAANECPDGWSCAPAVELDGPPTKMMCYASGAAPTGAPCDGYSGGANVCGPGLMCAPGQLYSSGGTTGPRCTPYCSLTDPGGACPVPGQQCLPLFDAATHPQYATLGACLESVTASGNPWFDIVYGF